MSTKQQARKKLQEELRELFQFDVADLDFGIYRILNRKREQIEEFIEKDLLDAVETGLEAYKAESESGLEEIKRKIRANFGASAIDVEGNLDAKYNETPLGEKYLKALEQEKNKQVKEETERQIYNDLLIFFSRYYDQGDFLTERRISTRDSKYAVPYNGEEVLLHWANKDQYYIKTGENFTNFKFELGNKSVWFKVAQAETERDNVKESESRQFVLRKENAIEETENELTIWFEYRALTDDETGRWLSVYNEIEKSRKTLDRRALCTAYDHHIRSNVSKSWKDALSVIPANKESSVLYYKLNHYTGKNTTDYFIHKDLKTFLERELEYFLKHEVIRVDDFISDASGKSLEVALTRSRVVKVIGQKIIAFLSQIENFQKKLFEKKKFVVDTHYCFTLDKIPEDLYETILENEAQLKEWEELYAMDQWSGDLDWDGNWTVEFMKAQPFMMVDTRFFGEEFSFGRFKKLMPLDNEISGLLLNGDNYQCISILSNKYKSKVKTTYIDPPYNSGSDDFPYKDGFRNSSWLTMLRDRIATADNLLSNDAVVFASIDDKDENNRVSHKLMQLLEQMYGSKNYLDNLIWVKNTTHNDAKAFSHNHEYILAFTKDKQFAIQESSMFRQAKPGYSEVIELVSKLNPAYPKITEIEREIRNLYKRRSLQYKKECLEKGLKWDDETKKNDPWKGIKQYKLCRIQET